jgi:hypothetical protein
MEGKRAAGEKEIEERGVRWRRERLMENVAGDGGERD